MGSVKMHADEAEITEDLVLRLVAAQFPDWAGLPVREIPSSGTVNAMYRLGDLLTVRLPRIKGGVSDIAAEWEWLPRLADALPVEIPTPVGRGEPGEGYPWIWSVQKWIPGSVPAGGSERLALELASFVQAFRRIELPGGPAAYRGGPLSEQDRWTRDALQKLEGWIDTETATAAWEAALAAAPAAEDVWVHGDLMPSNLLVADGGLVAVLDFATAGVGDPACDLIPAWNLLSAADRVVFREALEVDDDAWIRGRGRALSMALIQLPYYRDTNKGIAANAQYVIDQVLGDLGAAPVELRIERVDSEALMLDWQQVHNEIIPTDPLSLDDIRERVQRNILEVAYSNEILVGCSTVRPPSEETDAVTVIARVLPAYRRQGFGEALYRRGLARARELGGTAVETIILASNVEGLAFAEAQGFVEIERDVLPGHTIAFVLLRRDLPGSTAPRRTG